MPCSEQWFLPKRALSWPKTRAASDLSAHRVRGARDGSLGTGQPLLPCAGEDRERRMLREQELLSQQKSVAIEDPDRFPAPDFRAVQEE